MVVIGADILLDVIVSTWPDGTGLVTTSMLSNGSLSVKLAFFIMQ